MRCSDEGGFLHSLLSCHSLLTFICPLLKTSGGFTVSSVDFVGVLFALSRLLVFFKPGLVDLPSLLFFLDFFSFLDAEVLD